MAQILRTQLGNMDRTGMACSVSARSEDKERARACVVAFPTRRERGRKSSLRSRRSGRLMMQRIIKRSNFSAEEQSHARLLEHLVHRFDGKTIRQHWTHALFRLVQQTKTPLRNSKRRLRKSVGDLARLAPKTRSEKQSRTNGDHCPCGRFDTSSTRFRHSGGMGMRRGY